MPDESCESGLLLSRANFNMNTNMAKDLKLSLAGSGLPLRSQGDNACSQEPMPFFHLLADKVFIGVKERERKGTGTLNWRLSVAVTISRAKISSKAL